MGTTLTGKRVQNTYDSLLKITDNDNLTGVPKRITSGLGTDSPIYLSTDKIGIGMSPTVQFQTSGDAEIGNDLVVGGDLTVNGTTTFIDSTIVEIGDNMIELAKDNTANTKDIGWYGTINDGSEKFVGVFYDASTGTSTPTFRMGLGTAEPSSTASWTTKGKLIIGNIDTTGIDITGNLSVTGTIADSDGDIGTSGQVLSSTGSGTNWIDSGSSETAERIEIQVKNVHTGSLAKGTVVHVSPTSSPPSGNVVEVVRASYDDSTMMPAIGILKETIASGSEGSAVMMGALSGINTSSFSAGQELYVGSLGALTNTKPTSPTHFVQKIAVVIKVHASNGSIKVFGAGRANDVPNRIERDIQFTDNNKLSFGISNDLRLYHDGTDSYIVNSTGNIEIRNNKDDGDINFRSDNGSGGVTTYLAIDGGSEVVRFYKNAYFTDSKKALFGSSSDLQIYHDGSNSFVADTGTGGLFLEGNSEVRIRKQGTTEIMANFVADGSVNLYHNNSKKFETTSTGIEVTGNGIFSSDVKALRFEMNPDFAASNEYLIISKMQNQDGGIVLKSKPSGGSAQNDWQIVNHSSTGDLRFYAYGLGGFALTLDRENGNSTFAGSVSMNDLKIFDSNGSSTNRLKASYNGTSGVALFGVDSSGGNTELQIGTSNSGTYTTAITINSSQNTTFAGNITFGATNPFQQSTNVLDGTGTDGARIRSAVSSATNPTFSNSDDTNTGMFFAGSDTLGFTTGGTQRLQIDGDVKVIGSTDLNITGSNRRLSFTSGNGTIRTTTANNLLLQANNSTILELKSDGNAELTGNLDLRFNISSDAATIRDINFKNNAAEGSDDRLSIIRTRTQGGTSTTRGGKMSFYVRAANSSSFRETKYEQDGHWYFPSTVNIHSGDLELSGNNLNFGDNGKVRLGNSADLQLYHDGSNSYIDNSTGSLLIRNTNDNYHVIIQSDNGGGGLADYFRAKGDTGEAILYHYGVEKLKTTSTGIELYRNNGSPVLDFLRDGNNPTSNTSLHLIRYLVDYDGSHQNWGEIELRTTSSSSVRTQLNFNVKSQSGNVQNALTLQGQASAVPNAIFAGDVTTSGHYFANTHFRSTDAAAALSTTGAGTIYLRPNNYDSATGQFTLNSSGLGTFTGEVMAQEYNLPSGGMLDWANGDARIVEGVGSNYSLSFQTYDGSAVSEALKLYGDNTALHTNQVEIAASRTDGILLNLHNTSNGNHASIQFSDHSSGTQKGYISFKHSDSQSSGGGASFHFTSTEVDTPVVFGDSTNKSRLVVYGQYSNSEVDYGFGGDTNTGMYSPSYDNVGLVAGGSRKLLVNSSGVTINNGHLYIPQYIYHDGDTNTRFEFGNDVILLRTGSIDRLILTNDRADFQRPVVAPNLGRNNDDQVLFAITEADTNESIRRKFGNMNLTSLTRVDDSTAPAGGCFQITNEYYSVSCPELFKIDDHHQYTFEVWVKFVSGTDTSQMLYAGSSFYDSGKNYLGNSQRYWGASAVQVDADSRSDGQWYHVSGTLGPNRGTSTGDIPNSAEWMKLILLLNYSSEANTVRYCGLKFYASGGRPNRMFTSIYRKPLGREAPSADSWSGDTVMDTSGNLYTAEYLYHYGDTDSYLQWSGSDDFRIVVGGDELMRFDEGASGEHVSFFKSKFRFDNDKFLVDGGKLNVNNSFLNQRVEVYDASTARVRINSGTNNAGIQLVGSGSEKWDIYTNSNNLYLKQGGSTNRFYFTSGGDMYVNGGRIYLMETDLGNTALSLTRDGDEGYFRAHLNGDTRVEWRGRGDSYVKVSTTNNAFVKWFYNSSQVGSVVTTGSGTIYLTSSDYRLKENAVELTDALDRLDNLQPKRFNFITHPNETIDGFMAHEVSDIVPEAVNGVKDAVDENGDIIPQGIDQSKLVPLLVAAVKELKAEVESLRNQINS